MNDRVRLSTLLSQHADADPPVEPVVPFAAMFGDDVKIVTAVLERTAVLSEPSDRYDRKSVRHDQVLVDPAVITWRTRTSEYDGHRILNTGLKPGSDEARAAMHVLRKSPNRWRRSKPISPENLPGAEARQASDERALKNQQEVNDTKQRELAAHRQQSQKRHEGEAMSTVISEARTVDTTSTAPLAAAREKTKRCVICGNDKAASAFPVGPRGPQRCLDCRAKNPGALTLTSAATPATSGRTNGAPAAEQKTRKRRAKKARGAGKPRRGKKAKLGGVVFSGIGSPGIQPTLNDDIPRHTRVLALLRRQDALRTDLQRVTAELLEVVG